GFAISNGLERNMFLRFPRLLRRRARPLKKSLVAGRQSLAQISGPQPSKATLRVSFPKPLRRVPLVATD
ncbi:MAG: hypothetical protein WAM98_22060, partial [Terriglobales bacterium]